MQRHSDLSRRAIGRSGIQLERRSCRRQVLAQIPYPGGRSLYLRISDKASSNSLTRVASDVCKPSTASKVYEALRDPATNLMTVVFDWTS
jgi:hypothetical protein